MLKYAAGRNMTQWTISKPPKYSCFHLLSHFDALGARSFAPKSLLTAETSEARSTSAPHNRETFPFYGIYGSQVIKSRVRWYQHS